MKYNKYLLLLLFPVLFFVSGCSDDKTTEPVPEKSLEELYRSAVIDAMVAEDNEIVTTLTPITPSNTNLIWKDGDTTGYVKMLIFTKYASSYPAGDTVTTSWGITWATVVPELREWFNNNPVRSSKYLLRVEQLLGLPHGSGNEWMVELWVKPEDLLRPAYDNNIRVTFSGLYFPDSVSQDYVNWFNGNIVYSYFPAKEKNAYPWTRLGYTYDWGNSISEVGLSEFTIKKDARVIVNSVSNINQYLGVE
ncbi:MAG TPA: hypothetical protein PK397_12785 [Ignavibacteriaceae bacterium]|nr:hypothetical protein [Ignavibacteriaceae bacterium]